MPTMAFSFQFIGVTSVGNPSPLSLFSKALASYLELPAGTLTLKYVLPETSACAISPLYPFSFKDRITLSARALSVNEPTCTHHFVS